MSTGFESLVGYLYIVSGRSISAPPPGSLVEVAPRKVARGREEDTFYTIVLPSGDVPAPSAFYERMAHLGADVFFSSSGSVTAGLREVFENLNENLVAHNTRSTPQYEANMLAAVLHGDTFILGRVGAGVAVLMTTNQVTAFPGDFENDDLLFGVPIGVKPQPDVRMSSFQIAPGSRLLLADTNLAELDFAAIQTAMKAPDIAGVLVALKALSPQQITLMLVEFVPPELPDPIPLRKGTSTTEAAAAPIPVVTTAQLQAMPTQDLVEKIVETGDDLNVKARRSTGKLAVRLSGGFGLVNRILDRFIPRPEENRKAWLSTPAAAGAVVLVPIIIVGLVLGLWLTGTGESEFDLCIEEVTKAAQTARGIPSSDVNGIVAAWNAVIEGSRNCEEIRAGDPILASLVREGQDMLDRLFDIERRDAVVISAFPNANLNQVVMRGVDMYVLDDANDLVYRIQFSSDGRSMAPGTQRQPISTMRRGAAVNEFTVGDLFDIAWSEDIGGLSQGNVLVAVDRNGLLVEYSPTFLARGVQRLLGSETWVNPIAMNIWQGRLYILDPGQSQLWRYEASGGAYASPPTEYFTGEDRPDLRNAVDFGIDNSGTVYILISDGTLQKFRQGERVDFGFASFPEGQQITTANTMFLDNNPIAPELYIVSQSNRTVYETTLAGTFIAAYRTYDENQFASVANVVADVSQGAIYVVSGNSILAFDRAQ